MSLFPYSSSDLVVCWIPLHCGIFVSLLSDFFLVLSLYKEDYLQIFKCVFF